VWRLSDHQRYCIGKMVDSGEVCEGSPGRVRGSRG